MATPRYNPTDRFRGYATPPSTLGSADSSRTVDSVQEMEALASRFYNLAMAYDPAKSGRSRSSTLSRVSSSDGSASFFTTNSTGSRPRQQSVSHNSSSLPQTNEHPRRPSATELHSVLSRRRPSLAGVLPAPQASISAPTSAGSRPRPHTSSSLPQSSAHPRRPSATEFDRRRPSLASAPPAPAPHASAARTRSGSVYAPSRPAIPAPPSTASSYASCASTTSSYASCGVAFVAPFSPAPAQFEPAKRLTVRVAWHAGRSPADIRALAARLCSDLAPLFPLSPALQETCLLYTACGGEARIALAQDGFVYAMAGHVGARDALDAGYPVRWIEGLRRAVEGACVERDAEMGVRGQRAERRGRNGKKRREDWVYVTGEGLEYRMGAPEEGISSTAPGLSYA